MRYELKMHFPEAQCQAVVDKLMHGRFSICVKYPPRQVNNVYFDLPGFADYDANLRGDTARNKYRIRWYGALHGRVCRPTLERKHKEGNVGEKRSVLLPEFRFEAGFDYDQYLARLAGVDESNGEARRLISDLCLRRPTVVNSYQRRYLKTFDDIVTITVDAQQRFWLPDDALRENASARAATCGEIVVEYKFDEDKATLAEHMISDMGFRFDRNSKYVTGVRLLYEYESPYML